MASKAHPGYPQRWMGAIVLLTDEEESLLHLYSDQVIRERGKSSGPLKGMPS